MCCSLLRITKRLLCLQMRSQLAQRSRAGTFVLTAVVLACVMLAPRPSPCAGVRCHAGVQQQQRVRYSQTSCQLAARVQTAMKPPLPKGFAAGSPCLPAHTHTWQPCCSCTRSVRAMTGVGRCVHSAPGAVWASDPLSKGAVRATAKATQGGREEGRRQVGNPLNRPQQGSVLICYHYRCIIRPKIWA